MNTNTIKAIDTKYGGCLFRSRTEARWAVFYDALGVRWVYEMEGYVLNDGRRYLPDFFLPDHNCYIEIKGVRPTEEEKIKAQLLAIQSGRDVLIFWGKPGDYPEDCALIFSGVWEYSDDHYIWEVPDKNQHGWARTTMIKQNRFELIYSESNYIDWLAIEDRAVLQAAYDTATSYRFEDFK